MRICNDNQTSKATQIKNKVSTFYKLKCFKYNLPLNFKQK